MSSVTNEQEIIHIYIISDSVGDTALKVARSTLAQFPDAKTIIHRFSFVSSEKQLQEALEDALSFNGIVFMTIANWDQSRYAEKFCVETGLICYNLIQPFTMEIERRTGIQPSAIQGAQYELSDQYFDRIKAIEFTIAYDDGKNPQGLHEADIVILGVSRTGKTPISMYLGTLGYKVMNLPLIPEKELTPIIFEIDSAKIVGLTNEEDVIVRHRIKRMLEYGLSAETQYSSSERVKEELDYADDIYRKLQCPVINVSDRSIEETARIIVDLLQMPIRN